MLASQLLNTFLWPRNRPQSTKYKLLLPLSVNYFKPSISNPNSSHVQLEINSRVSFQILPNIFLVHSIRSHMQHHICVITNPLYNVESNSLEIHTTIFWLSFNVTITEALCSNIASSPTATIIISYREIYTQKSSRFKFLLG